MDVTRLDQRAYIKIVVLQDPPRDSSVLKGIIPHGFHNLYVHVGTLF